ncbi:MAG: PKD domain-containing protein, partial [Patescibacteria group bacterium]
AVEADDQDVGVGETLTGNVKTKFTFDASNSVNTEGLNSGLTYTWNFGDGSISSQKVVTHTFTEHLTYNVSLTVKDQENPSVTSTDTIQIVIQGIDPEIRGLSFVPEGDSLVTPLQVDVTVDAIDQDGEISFVKGWYYDLNDSATELGTVISQSTNFTLTLNTKGEEGDEVEYGFAVEVTDDDNRTVSSFDELSEEETPTLTVTNGPKDNPVAEFSVDKTSVIIGEEVHFSSLSYDPDGEIVEYVWDVEGDGFFNNTPQTEPSYVYAYSQIHSDGVEVQLRVTDSAGATATSETLTLYVDSISEPPDAAFLADVEGKEVQFHNNSFIDEENGAELQGVFWDFDTDADSNGNGVNNDDIDSLEEEPVHTYENFETYGVKMTVVDSAGQTDTVERDVIVKETNPPVAAFTTSVDDKTVEFTNNSTTDEANDVDFREYIWDFDADTDADGDGDA